MKNYIAAILLCCTILCGCIPHQAFYQSPYNGIPTPYHVMPLTTEGKSSSTYVGGNIYFGNANADGTDDNFLFMGNIYHTNQWKNIQAYYGADLSIGNYGVASLDSTPNLDATVNYKDVDAMSGNKFYGGVGASGGINYVLPFKGGEWRIVGVELNTHKEFGSYLDFRNKLPDSAATLIIRNSDYSTWGIYTEIIGKTKIGSVGFRLATGKVINPEYNNLNIYDDRAGGKLTFAYFDFSTNITCNRWTGYFIINFATKADGMNLGATYQLGAKQKRQ